MKKTIVLMLVGALALTTVMSGCGKSGDADTTASADAESSADEDLSSEPESQVVELDLKEIDYDPADYVTLGEYKNMDVDVDSQYEVTDENVQSTVSDELLYYPEEIEDGTVEDGDTVNIDYVGSVDGEEFDGGSAEGYDLEIGSGTFIDGFEDQLIGHGIGENFDINVTFPDDYSSTDLAGKDAVFNITINSISRPITYDELTDDFVSENLGYDTVDEYLESVREELQDQQDSACSSAAANKAIDNATVNSLPDGLVEQNCAIYKNQYIAMCEQYGYTFDDFLEGNGMTEDDFDEEVSEYITENLSQQIILEAIAEAEGIEIDEDGYQEYVDSLLTNYGYESADDLYAEYTEHFVRSSYLCNTLMMDFMLENNTFTFKDTAEIEAESESADDTATEDVSAEAE